MACWSWTQRRAQAAAFEVLTVITEISDVASLGGHVLGGAKDVNAVAMVSDLPRTRRSLVR